MVGGTLWENQRYRVGGQLAGTRPPASDAWPGFESPGPAMHTCT